jgi:hypothetical protein
MANTVTLTYGTLFHVSAQQFQDQDQWIRIMTVNGMTDPWINSAAPITLIIPSPNNPDPQGEPTAGISTPMVL